jgi:protein-tyrosine-phosphatase
MTAILFVCFANRFRSPLAAAFFSQSLEKVADRKSWSVSSAGTWTENGLPADIRAIKDANEWGLDIRAHRSRQVDALILSKNNLILVMETGQKEALRIEFSRESRKIFLLSEVVDGSAYDIPDPFGGTGVTHMEVATELHALIESGFTNIYNAALKSEKEFS